MTSSDESVNCSEVQRFLHLLWQEGEVRELRSPKYNRYGCTASGYFEYPEVLAKMAAEWDGKCNLYITLNPVNPSLLARASNRIDNRAQNTTADTDILRRHWFFLDIDPIRPSGISSTEAEREAAHATLTSVTSFLSSSGWPEPVTAMSGNGYYALYRIDLPNTPEVAALIKAALKSLAFRFDTSAVNIDTAVDNASRTAAVIGTMKCKGDSTPERPHRRSTLLSVPDSLDIIQEDQLRALVDQTPKPANPSQSLIGNRGGHESSLQEILEQKGIEYRIQPPDAQGVTWYHVRRCPFHDDGHDFECGVGQKLPDGPYAGKCFHNPEGVGKGWREWKEALGLWPSSQAAAMPTRIGLQITIDDTTYLERLDLNRIISETYVKKGAPLVTKTMSSFIIKPLMRISLDGESERLDAELKTGEATYVCSFEREVWNSRKQFLAALPSVDLQYYGTDKDTQSILAMVNSQEIPKRKGTKVLGRNDDLWVLKDRVLSKDGWLENPDIVYIPSELDFDRRVHYPTIKDEDALIKQVIPSLMLLNEGKNLFPVLGWFFSTPYVPEIRRRLGHFPLLVVWGTHGAGKSSLLRLLWQLFGVESELFSSTETSFTFLRLFSSTSTVPIIIDEFKPFNMKEDESRLLIRYLKRLYDGEIEHRGRPDLTLVSYHLQAPTVIAGEVSPISLESALVDRVIQVNLNPDAFTANPPYTSAFNELAGLGLGAFAVPYIRWALGTSLDELLAEARALLPAALQDVSLRVRDNALVMVIGLVALNRFAQQYGVKIDQEAIKEGIKSSINGVVAELFEKGTQDEIGLTIFLKTLATLAQTGRIKHGIHYTTSDKETRLYIHMSDCLAEFRKFVRETSARVEVLDEKAYRTQAKEVCLRNGYVLNTNILKWFKSSDEEGGVGKTRRCTEIDMELLPFDTSGFQKPVKG